MIHEDNKIFQIHQQLLQPIKKMQMYVSESIAKKEMSLTTPCYFALIFILHFSRQLFRFICELPKEKKLTYFVSRVLVQLQY